MEESWYLEYSTEQKCFHIDTLDKIKKINLELVRKGICNGYVIIAGPDSWDNIQKIAEVIREELRDQPLNREEAYDTRIES